MNRRTVVLVIDGLGIGAMPDVIETRPQDRNANTLKNIVSSIQFNELPTLMSLGLSTFIAPKTADFIYQQFRVAYGKNTLAHHGADTYWGHQEIVGSQPSLPTPQSSVHSKRDVILKALLTQGYAVRFFKRCMVVNNSIFISDNIEADPGLNFNVIGSLGQISFHQILTVATLIRSCVTVGRIIAQGGTTIDSNDIIKAIEQRRVGDNLYYGVNVASLHIYNDSFCSRHLGYGTNPEVQMPSILARAGIDVMLIGKAADVINCPHALKKPTIATETVFDLCEYYLSHIDHGLIMANMQEIDLAGHEQNIHKQARMLSYADLRIGKLLTLLHHEDILIITADHGNDALIGHSKHAREYTPLLVISKSINSANLGIRQTMSDIAATICEWYGTEKPQNGVSFLKSITA